MEKTEAIKLLGGTPSSAAAAVGITPQAVSSWPDVLPQRIVDRVQAALWRMSTTKTVAPIASDGQQQQAA